MRWRRDWAERRKKRANGLAREKLQLPANRRNYPQIGARKCRWNLLEVARSRRSGVHQNYETNLCDAFRVAARRAYGFQASDDLSLKTARNAPRETPHLGRRGHHRASFSATLAAHFKDSAFAEASADKPLVRRGGKQRECPTQTDPCQGINGN
jgi:hypothetical protein